MASSAALVYVEITVEQIEDAIREFANELIDIRRRIERRRSSDSEDDE
jgi:predicted  nucleic acid-binding Zn-ribbon protein